jgi:putative exosortase-associated protein (TIGR04073 family)
MRRTLAFLLVLPLVAPPAWAATTRDTGDYGPTDKLSRGVANITTGVLALPGTIAQKTEEDGASGVPVGIGMGLYHMVARELVGVYDLVTFPLPQPNNYRPVMQPAYPWQYFTQSGDVRPARTHHEDRYAAETSTHRTEGTRTSAPEAAHSGSGRRVNGTDVRDVQQRLSDMGYQPGPVDGVIGPKTRAAVRAFQKDNDLHQTGRLDHDTLAAMNSAHGKPSPTAGTRGPSGTEYHPSAPSTPESQSR